MGLPLPFSQKASTVHSIVDIDDIGARVNIDDVRAGAGIQGGSTLKHRRR